MPENYSISMKNLEETRREFTLKAIFMICGQNGWVIVSEQRAVLTKTI